MRCRFPTGVRVAPQSHRVARRMAAFHSSTIRPARDGPLSSNQSAASPDLVKVDIPESSFPELYTSSIFTGNGEPPRSDINQIAQATRHTEQVRSTLDKEKRRTEPPQNKRQSPKTHKDTGSDPLRMAKKFNKEYNLKGWRLDEDGDVLTPLDEAESVDSRLRPNVKYLDPGSVSDADWNLLKGKKVDEIDMGHIYSDIHDSMGFESNATEFLDRRPSTTEDAVPKFTDIRYATSYTYIVHKDRTVTLEIPGEIWPVSTDFLVNFQNRPEEKKRYPLVPKLKEGIQTSADFNRAYMKEYPMEPLFRAILEANYSERSIHMHNVITDAEVLISLFTYLKGIKSNSENLEQVSIECTKVAGRTILSLLDVVVPENKSLNLRARRRLADTARASVYEIASTTSGTSRSPISFEKGFGVRPHFRVNSVQFGNDFWMLVRFRVDARKIKGSVNAEEQQLNDEQYIDKLPWKPRLTYTDIPSPNKVYAPYVPDKYKLATIKSAKYDAERVKNYDAYFTRIQNEIIARYNWRCDRLATIQASPVRGTYFQDFEELYGSELIALRQVLDRFTKLDNGQYIIRNDRDTLMIYHKRDGKIDVVPSDLRAYVTEYKKRPSVVEELQFNIV
ncbi:hypothetical protein V1520DRAFT_344578 [Lipomyces starkeyi]|uniref:Uncharacterized protein n=1 Tax=Lipomyces starkeyi NRRL Y-11557 TaxID=675824 RepID=A0A1E3PV02_LIPST|nr:hypothetical protein LIPSTDRAFT_200929 [Lipomyces starkeyi NRRL Y-11557]